MKKRSIHYGLSPPDNLSDNNLFLPKEPIETTKQHLNPSLEDLSDKDDDTVNEAPSITDEVQITYNSIKDASKSIMIISNVDKHLQEAYKEGQEVKNELLKNNDFTIEESSEKQFNEKPKMSHF